MDCESGTQTLEVGSPGGALEVAEAVNCNGGTFEVDWVGNVRIETTISIPSGTSVTVIGSEEAAVDGGHALQLFEVTGGTLSLATLELRNGNGTSGAAVSAKDNSTLILDNCEVTGNNATTNGGAIAVESYSELVLVGNNLFRGNTASDDGGAVYVSDSSALHAPGITRFVLNSAYTGGAIASSDYSVVNITGEAHFRSNSASTNGGAVYGTESNLTIVAEGNSAMSTFFSNSAEDLAGALYWRGMIDTTYTFDIVRVLMADNSAESGGAVYCASHLEVNMDSSRFESNYARYDAGALILHRVGDEDEIEVTNCTFEYNRAEENGGAVIVVDGSVTMANSSFIGNIAGEELPSASRRHTLPHDAFT